MKWFVIHPLSHSLDCGSVEPWQTVYCSSAVNTHLQSCGVHMALCAAAGCDLLDFVFEGAVRAERGHNLIEGFRSISKCPFKTDQRVTAHPYFGLTFRMLEDSFQ